MKRIKYGLIVLVFPVFLGIYMRFIEPIWIKTNFTEIQIKNHKHIEIKIAHVSDFHWSNVVSLDYLEESFKSIKSESPDLILITGDFITRRENDFSPYSKVLSILPSIAPTLACPGNHDGGVWAFERGSYETTFEVKKLLEESGIIYLENKFEIKIIKEVKILLGGLGDIWAGNCGPEIFIEEFDSTKADLKIILTHNPDSKFK